MEGSKRIPLSIVVLIGFKDEDEFIRGYRFSFQNHHTKLFINYFRNKNMWNEDFYYESSNYILDISEIKVILQTNCAIWYDEEITFLLSDFSVNEGMLLFEYYYANKEWMVVTVKEKRKKNKCPQFVVLPEDVFLKYAEYPSNKRLETKELEDLKNMWKDFMFNEKYYEYNFMRMNPKEFLIPNNEKWMKLTSNSN